MKKGFGLIGLLVTLVIIGALMAFVLPQYTQTTRQQHQRRQGALQQVRDLQKQIDSRQHNQRRAMQALENGTRPRR